MMRENMVFTSKRGKQIVFDDFCDDYENDEEIPFVWVEMCPHCHRKYRVILGNRCDDGGTAQGMCSVKGCNNTANYYVDFNPNEVTFILEEDEDND